jgi:hypothetical protein
MKAGGAKPTNAMAHRASRRPMAGSRTRAQSTNASTAKVLAAREAVASAQASGTTRRGAPGRSARPARRRSRDNPASRLEQWGRVVGAAGDRQVPGAIPGGRRPGGRRSHEVSPAPRTEDIHESCPPHTRGNGDERRGCPPGLTQRAHEPRMWRGLLMRGTRVQARFGWIQPARGSRRRSKRASSRELAIHTRCTPRRGSTSLTRERRRQCRPHRHVRWVTRRPKSSRGRIVRPTRLLPDPETVRGNGARHLDSHVDSHGGASRSDGVEPMDERHAPHGQASYERRPPRLLILVS